MDSPHRLLDLFMKRGNIPVPLQDIVAGFIGDYMKIVKERGADLERALVVLQTFISLVEEGIEEAFVFQPFHQRIDKPFDYYHFGMDLFRPLILFEESYVLGLDVVQEIVSLLEKGENVVLLANHQTEPDPQALSLLLEKSHPEFAKEMVFVAGHRVTTDPLAIPFSKGRNLLCIFSKKRMENPPEEKEKKMLHNQKAMQKLAELLSKGGVAVYVAPSGGRDRVGKSGKVEVAPFDPQSVEMFRLIAKKSGTKTHFYPLALWTYAMLPPPASVDNAFGEARTTSSTPIRAAFGKRLDFDQEGFFDAKGKEGARVGRAEYAWNKVREVYAEIEIVS